jgi:hypothetical protein
VTLLLVPVIYATCVLDLKLVAWHEPHVARETVDANHSAVHAFV